MAKKGAFVYIDAENLKGSVEACGYAAMDFSKLLNWLRTSRNAQRVYLYAGFSDDTTKDFYKNLEKQGYIIGIKPVMQYRDQVYKHRLKCPSCGKTHEHSVTRYGRRKANCDSELTLDVINDGVRKKYDEIIVFSGDGDFCRMYEYVTEILKKKVTVYSPMSGEPGYRTAQKVKLLGAKRIITVNALEGILPQYGIK